MGGGDDAWEVSAIAIGSPVASRPSTVQLTLFGSRALQDLRMSIVGYSRLAPLVASYRQVPGHCTGSPSSVAPSGTRLRLLLARLLSRGDGDGGGEGEGEGEAKEAADLKRVSSRGGPEGRGCC